MYLSSAVGKNGLLHVTYFDARYSDMKYIKQSCTGIASIADENCDKIDGIDRDQDSFASFASGGKDCDDNKEDVYPGQNDSIGDGTDVDCDGFDGSDSDRDGYFSIASGGDDCNDTNASINPGIFDAADGMCEIYGWDIAVLDSQLNTGEYAPFKIGSDNVRHIAFHSAAGLVYANTGSGSWQTAVIDTVSQTSFASMDLDSADHVHIAYQDSANKDMKYATDRTDAFSCPDSGNGWCINSLDTADTGYYTSIAVDGKNAIHILYLDANKSPYSFAVSSYLKYMTNKSGTWVSIIIVRDAGSYSDIDTDNNDFVHMSYSNRGALFYRTNRFGEWVNVQIDYGKNMQNSLLVDDDGFVHIAYSNKYATNRSGIWKIFETDKVSSTGNSMTADSSGQVHISYQGEGTIKYAWNGTGSWRTIPFILQSAPSVFTSVELNVSGTAEIMFIDSATKKIMNAKQACTTFGTPDDSNCDDIDGTDLDRDGSASLVSGGLDCNDKDENVAVSQPDLTINGIDEDCNGVDGIDEDMDGYASNTAGGNDCNDADADINPGIIDRVDGYCSSLEPSILILDTSAGIGASSSIAVDSNDSVHILYQKNGLIHATNSSGIWNSETVDSGGGNYISMRTDSNDFLHMAYYFSGDMKYATNRVDPQSCPDSGNGFCIVTVDSFSDTGIGASLALDSSDASHISYSTIQWPDLFVNYATNKSGAWTVEKISNKYSYHSSIAVDNHEIVHILIINESKLYYLTNESGSWETAQLTSGYVSYERKNLSIQFDKNNFAHITYHYYSSNGGQLMYKTSDTSRCSNPSGAWCDISMEPFEDTGYYNVLAVDQRNFVHLCYYDYYSAAFRYFTDGSGSWQATVIDDKDTGINASMALDSQDIPHFSYTKCLSYDQYYQCTKYELRYATMQCTGFGSGGNTNCDAMDGIDADNDGFASYFSGGTDCDDTDPLINPSSDEITGDNDDSNCNGYNDL